MVLGYQNHGGENRPGLTYSLEILKSTALNQFFEFDNEQDCIWKLETYGDQYELSPKVVTHIVNVNI